MASAIAASGLDQANPRSSAGKGTHSMITGIASARRIRACQRLRPASKDSMSKPSYNRAIGVSHTLAVSGADHVFLRARVNWITFGGIFGDEAVGQWIARA